MPRILITGGAGFIGSNLVDFFLSYKNEVFVIDNLLTGSKKNIEFALKKNNFHFIFDDVITVNLKKIFQGRPFDLIYHLASPASPKQYIKYPLQTLLVNSEGTNNILKYALETKSKKIIFASTSEIYGDPKEHPQNEDYWGNVNPVGLRSCYDEGKRFGEALSMTYLRKYGLNISIARIFNTYGPNMEKEDGRVISNFIVQALSNTNITIYGSGKQTRSFCFVKDMIEALYLMSTKNLGGQIINLGNPEEKTIIEIAGLIKKITSSQSKIVFKPIPPDDPKRRKPDITKASKLLGFKPKIKLIDGLLVTVKYFKKRFGL